LKITFHHLSGSRAGERQTFDRRVLTIGRDPANDIAFDPHKDVRCSSFHAEVRCEGDTVWLRDLGSTNGTFVNDLRITERALNPGDVVTFGFAGPSVRVESGPVLSRRTDPVGRDVPTRSCISFTRLDGSADAVETFLGQVVTAGRSPDCDLRFNPEKDLSVSWRHGRFVWQGGEWWYEDTGSRNGTYVNDVPQQRHQVADSDVIRFGPDGPAVRVRLAAAEAEARPCATLPCGRAAVSADDDDGPVPVILLDELPPGGIVPIGRAGDQRLRLTHPTVSRRHAIVRRTLDGFAVEDLGSMNGVFVNAERVVGSRRLAHGDRVHIGAYVITFTGDRLCTVDHEGRFRVAAEAATVSVWSRCGARAPVPRLVLADVSLVINPREFVAILGPVGAGKSTLMNVLSGRTRPTAGAVYYNEDDFFRHFDTYRAAIGYVPQRDIVHEQLTVAEALDYAVRLRLPGDTSAQEARDRVEEVLEQVELSTCRHERIGRLSGGQHKRVNLGVELVARPSVLFLDEATSGLDAGADLEMMSLFRRVADEGRTVICVTHNVEYVEDQCNLAVLLHQGRLVFFGPPSEMLSHFRINRMCQVYGRLKEKPVEHWVHAYAKTAWHRDYLSKRLEKHAARRRAQPPTAQREAVAVQRSRSRPAVLRQFRTLASRYLTVVTRDARNLAILFSQAPVIGLIVGAVMGPPGASAGPAFAVAHHAKVGFFLVLAAAWFGCINAAREIVKETDIFRRERAVCLSVIAYVLSKLLPLLALCAAQCAVLLAVVRPMTGLPGNAALQLTALFATAGASALLGLLLSAFASTEDRAIRMVPLVLIPQVVLSDAVVQLSGLSLLSARMFVLTYWSYDAMKVTLGEALMNVNDVLTPLRHVVRPGETGEPAAVLGRLGHYGWDLGMLGLFSLAFLLLTMMRLGPREGDAPQG